MFCFFLVAVFMPISLCLSVFAFFSFVLCLQHCQKNHRKCLLPLDCFPFSLTCLGKFSVCLVSSQSKRLKKRKERQKKRLCEIWLRKITTKKKEFGGIVQSKTRKLRERERKTERGEDFRKCCGGDGFTSSSFSLSTVFLTS